MTATVYWDDVNELAYLTNTWVNTSGAATDPSTVTCVVTDPGGNTITHTYLGTAPADIQKALIGKYTLAVSCAPLVAGSDGLWLAEWIGVGTGIQSNVQPNTWRVFPASLTRMYCGLEELKDRLGITDNSDDFTAEQSIQAASTWVNEWCVVPETPVLTADLHWVPAGELLEGDELVGFDEYPVGLKYPKRHYRRAVVTAAPRRLASCTRIVLEDGREVITADDHRWLAKNNGGDVRYGKRGRCTVYDWIPACTLQPGSRIASPVRVWSESRSFEDGWMAGLFDGEGWVHRARNGKSAHLSIGQNPGHVLVRVEQYLKEAGLPYGIRGNSQGVSQHKSWGANCQRLDIYQRWASMELMGRLQPCRLMPLSDELWVDGHISRHGADSSVGVVSVEPAGVREVVSLGTTTGTYIANGLASHNCGQHFYQVTETRTFVPHDIWQIDIDPLVAVTAVNVDQDGQGVYADHWTLNTDYQLKLGEDLYNINAAGVKRPYKKIQVTQTGKWFPYIYPYAHLDRVQVVGTWGWPAVPPAVSQATLMLAAQFFKEKDAPFGVAGVSDFGVLRITQSPTIQMLLTPYVNGKRKVGVLCSACLAVRRWVAARSRVPGRC